MRVATHGYHRRRSSSGCSIAVVALAVVILCAVALKVQSLPKLSFVEP